VAKLSGDEHAAQDRKRSQYRRWAELHQERVGKRWDKSLKFLQTIDFTKISTKKQIKGLIKIIHRWRDLTLKPVRRLTPMARSDASIEVGEDNEDYMCRVLVGMDLKNYNLLCENLVREVERGVGTEGLQTSRPEWRDRIVELMETGVRASTRAIEWIDSLGRAPGPAIGEGSLEA
jgi:hypothetical protein